MKDNNNYFNPWGAVFEAWTTQMQVAVQMQQMWANAVMPKASASYHIYTRDEDGVVCTPEKFEGPLALSEPSGTARRKPRCDVVAFTPRS